MEYFILFDKESKLTQIVNYEPNVPSTVIVKPLTSDEYKYLEIDQTHYYDIILNRIKPRLPSDIQTAEKQKELERRNAENYAFLSSTDWKIMRHIREKTLGLSTSMTEEEMIQLEKQRDQAAKSIIH